jgi:hypothetical protein
MRGHNPFWLLFAGHTTLMDGLEVVYLVVLASWAIYDLAWAARQVTTWLREARHE